MKIKKIDVLHLSVPLKKPYKLSKLYGTLYTTEPVVVKITTDEGMVGVGETDPMPLFTGETAETAVTVIHNYLAPALIGKDPTNIACIHHIMDGVIRDMHLAKAAVDMACYDIMGKAAGMSVATLLGGRIHDSLPIMGSIGGGTPEDNAREAVSLIEDKGYASLMVKIGSDDYMYDAERTIAIAKAVGDKVVLIPDANQGWDVTTTLKYLDAVSGCNVDAFEQPIHAGDIDGFAKIKQGTNVKLTADESLLSLEHAKMMIKEKSVDIFSIKVCKTGGIYRSKEIIELSRHFGIQCLFNSMIEEGITQAASFALGCSTRNLYAHGHAYFSPLRLEDDITNFSTFIKNGRINVPDTPGLGIEVDDEKLAHYTKDRYKIV
ncbi:MAG: hypothetical protein MJA31_08885 [Clostridia bacterium]|nr:hypothetical protein [Clostridia bacterium]